MNYFFNIIEEKNKKFIEILKNIILENRNSLDQERIRRDDYQYSRNRTYELSNLANKINEINKDLNIFKINIEIRQTGHKNKIDYYISIKPEDKNNEEYIFHFHLNKKKMEFKVITHNFNLIEQKISRTFTYTPNSTIYEFPKEKKTIKLQDKNTQHNIEELSDIFLLTHDINFLDDLNFSLNVIGSDKDKEKFIKKYENNKNPSLLKKLINKII